MDVYHSHGGSNLKSIKRYHEYALMAAEAWFKSI
jgi:hypothetical protein